DGEKLSSPVVFDFEDRSTTFVAEGIRFSIQSQYAWTEPFAIKLSCIRLKDTLRLEFQYDPERFSADTIQRVAGHFQVLLDSALADSDTEVSRLSLLSEADLHQLLVDFNQTVADYPGDKSVHELFEEQAQRSPDSVAVVCGEQKLSF